MESLVKGQRSVARSDERLTLERPVRSSARKPMHEQNGRPGAVIVVGKANTVCGSKRLFMTSQLRLLGQ